MKVSFMILVCALIAPQVQSEANTNNKVSTNGLPFMRGGPTSRDYLPSDDVNIEVDNSSSALDISLDGDVDVGLGDSSSAQDIFSADDVDMELSKSLTDGVGIGLDYSYSLRTVLEVR